MEQCRQGKSVKWIRNFGKRIGSEVPNPPVVGGLLELHSRLERAAVCGLGDGLGTALLGAFLERLTTNSELVRSRGIRLFI
ncbi:hypothetical protein IEQ34_007518 [Dendrobium chrysotoxum]|uniref:NADH-ubiquinone oxidoreductase 51kDa subunit iron-sulphur binding domain-containing protein n=1 Tax=Dendrobium chrysotoxum TaxID=161865 RepID=A0AAV7H3A5_DENCH|nr:hypothetical protein IEQ34_007518 [Dendrobium chrysotoxum]